MMRKLLVFFSFFLFVSSAHATAQRTFVSAGTGSDANLCTRTEPCRNFSAALAQTTSGGEVIVLDSGGYGSFVISTPVAVMAPAGVYAGVTGFGGSAIAISGTTSGPVTLGGLTINALGGSTGINFQSGKSLYVDDALVSGFTVGLAFNLGTLSANLYVTDSKFRNNANGIDFEANSGGTVVGTFERVLLHENSQAIIVGGSAKATMRQCIAASSSVRGFWSAGGGAELNLENCLAMNNGSGLWVNSGAVMRVSNSTIVNNATGATIIGGTLYTRGNNTIGGNGTDGDTPTNLPGW